MNNFFSFLCKKSPARSSYSQIQTGMDQTKFKEHIIPLQSPMQLLAERMLGDVADAEDVVQDVFVALWSRRDELDRVVKLDSYCLQMVRLRCIDLIRKRKRDAFHNEQIAYLSDKEVTMQVEETRNDAALLDHLLDELPEKQRRALRMKYVEERDTQYIEQALQMSSNNVYTTISRAIQSLKDKIKTLKI